MVKNYKNSGTPCGSLFVNTKIYVTLKKIWASDKYWEVMNYLAS